MILPRVKQFSRSFPFCLAHLFDRFFTTLSDYSIYRFMHLLTKRLALNLKDPPLTASVKLTAVILLTHSTTGLF